MRATVNITTATTANTMTSNPVLVSENMKKVSIFADHFLQTVADKLEESELRYQRLKPEG